MRHTRLRPTASVLLATVLAGCAATPTRTPALYEQLGGRQGVHAITERMIDAFARDRQVAPFFAHVDIPRFSNYFSAFICQLADGPCQYKGDSMAEVHRGLAINEAQFNAVVQDLIAAMNERHIPVPVQNRLIARLAPLRGAVIYR